MLTKGMALELAPHNITVNGIAPGPTTTDFTEPVLSIPEYRAAALQRVPLGRFAEPEEMVGTVVLLVSDQGSYITGQTIFIDGGTIL
jgi:NAD(P)-dependent dehydrogenase (short-subunit alcohol dehydrogenase family)